MTSRYRPALRTHGIREDEAIDLEALYFGDVGTWDTVQKCFVEKNEAGEWVQVPEKAKS